MPKARKLPSGSWRCQIYKNGIRKSFTVDDPTMNGKRRCEMLASEWADSTSLVTYMSVENALKGYVSAKRGKLSPTTIVGYESMIGHAFEDIKDRPLTALSDQVVQRWIDKRSEEYSAKSVRNEYAFLNSAVSRYTGIKFKCDLPEGRPHDYVTPTDGEVSALLKATEGKELHKAIILAAFGTLREGECSALRIEDITGSQITVRRAYGWDGERYVLKEPKTASSSRTVTLPEEVMPFLTPNEDGRIVNLMPSQISSRYQKTARKLGIKFRFHDLRAYAASVRHAMGIPDAYIMADGGWKTDAVLKRVYRRAMEDRRKEFSKVSNAHFSEVFAHGIAHEEN